MKTVSSILILLLAGSLWGIVEILPLPTALHCSFGVLMLVAARVAVPRVGTGVLIGLVVCMFKTASATFMVCQWTGVLSLAVSFEIMYALFRSRMSSKAGRAMVIGAGTCLLALPLFTGWVTLVAAHPYWIEGGWVRIGTYALATTAPAMLAGLLLAPLGIRLGKAVVASDITVRPPAYWFGGMVIVATWSIALFT